VKFFDPAADWAPEGDFALCSALDVVDFAVELRRQPEGFLALQRVA
jgi:2-phosphosulfolactate phosphatase